MGRFKAKKIRKRVGSRKKAGFEGKANQFISRTKATKKLQVSLPVFRKLCILKGIYPMDPKMKHRRHGPNKVYYHVRDIKHLRREPLLWKYRELQTHKNKLTRHKGRHDWDSVKSLDKQKPVVRVDHLIRERYPHFNDALRDLDDCLCIVHLFSSLPSGKVKSLGYDRRIHCANLTKQWMNYVVSLNLLRKAFVSVKGVYYEVLLQNKFRVVYLVPHEFAQRMPSDVDYRVLSTFLEFYETMLQFVLVRLYKLKSLTYPPFEITETSAATHSLTKLILKSNSKSSDSSASDSNSDRNDDADRSAQSSSLETVTLDVSRIPGITKSMNDESANSSSVNEQSAAIVPSKTKRNRLNLFEGFVFLINRECPQISLEFVILSMKGKVHFIQKFDERKHGKSITHQIIDRPMNDGDLSPNRTYVQPQWVYDCLNVGIVVPSEHYGPNMQCPPHLSPFTEDNRNDDYPLQSAPVKTTQELVIEHWKELAESYGGFVPTAQKLGSGKMTHDVTMDNETEVSSKNVIVADLPPTKEDNDGDSEMIGAGMVDSEMLQTEQHDGDSDANEEDENENDDDEDDEPEGDIDDFLAAEAPDYQAMTMDDDNEDGGQSGDKNSSKGAGKKKSISMEDSTLSKQERLDIERVQIAQSMRKRQKNGMNNEDNDSVLPSVLNQSLSEQIKEAKMKARKAQSERETLAKVMMPGRHRKVYNNMMNRHRKKDRKKNLLERRNLLNEKRILSKKKPSKK